MVTNLNRKQHYYTLEEYFALEKVGDARYEYWDGEIFCMSGGSKEHYRLTRNIYRWLDRVVQGGKCEAFMPDTPITTPKLPPYRYPDASVVCGESRFENIHGIDALVNPILIVEVLSPTTELADKEDKRIAYQAIESLQEYVLIAQDKVEVTHYTRKGDLWFRDVVSDLSTSLQLTSLASTITLAELYRGVVSQ
ncbi:MAG: Uma2 family endonuclease [Blastocatellia bacterium]|nr:Uma2 family endonuclease [Blastocatellia bacterium]